MLSSSYPNKKIIVADNASTDNSVAMLRKEFSDVIILVNTKNSGFAGGYNWALQQVHTDYCVLLNSDVEVTPNWIEPIIAIMEADKNIAACQPKILSFANKKEFEYAGASGGWIDMFGYPFCRGRIFFTTEKDEGQYDDIQKVFWASGAALFTRPDVFRALQGFDEYFFAHQEEIDLCWRMQLAGYTIMVCPQSVVYHVGGGTLSRSKKKTFLNFRNNLLMLGKNLPTKSKLWVLPIRFGIDVLSALKNLCTGNIAFFSATIQAHFSVLCLWCKGYKKHDLTKKKLAGLDGTYPRNVLWQYIMCRTKKFSQIVKKK